MRLIIAAIKALYSRYSRLFSTNKTYNIGAIRPYYVQPIGPCMALLVAPKGATKRTYKAPQFLTIYNYAQY